MKKFFSLVLALVMALSLTTVAWGAGPWDVNGTGYATFADAMAAVTDNTETTVTLTANTIESITIPANKVIKLDLGAFTLTSASTGYPAGEEPAHATITVASGATLTVVGTGTVDNTYHGGAALRNQGGTVVLNGGTFTRSNENGINWPYNPASARNTHYTVYNDAGTMTINAGVAIVNGAGTASALANEGTLTINGGSVTGGRHTINNEGGATLEVNGGTFSGGADNILRNRQDATINGGTFTATGTANVVKNEFKSGETTTAATTTIAGGDFTGAFDNGSADAAIVVSGGTFNTDVSEYVASGSGLVQDTNGNWVAGAAVTMGDKYDLYQATDKLTANIKLGATSVADVALTEKLAKSNLDGSGNIAYIEGNNGEFYVKTTTPTINSYAVTYANKDTILYYVNAVGTNENAFFYAREVKAFSDWGIKCGQVNNVTYTIDPKQDYYKDPVDGKVYMAQYDAQYLTNKAYNVLLNGYVVTKAATGMTITDHTFVANNFMYDTKLLTNVPTSAICTTCTMTTSAIYKDGKVPATYTRYPMANGNGYVVGLAPNTVIPGTVVVPSTPSTDKVTSADTFDAGIAMYVGMSVMAAAGSAVVIGKKKD